MFELQELQVLRSSLNVIDIKGANAQLVANLQVKVENEMLKIENYEELAKLHNMYARISSQLRRLRSGI